MQAQALDLLLCGACHGHRFYMILLMSSAVPPSHRTRLLCCIAFDADPFRPLYCMRTALQYNDNNHGSLEQCHHLHLCGRILFCFLFFCPRCPVWPRSHCSLRPGPTARSSLCLVAQQVSSLQDNSTKRQSSCSTTWATNSHLGPSSNASLVWC